LLTGISLFDRRSANFSLDSAKRTLLLGQTLCYRDRIELKYENYKYLTSEDKLDKIREIRSCLDEVSNPEVRCELLYRLGFLCMSCSQYKPALDAFDHILKNKQNDYNAWYGRGTSLCSLGIYQEALDSFINSHDHYAWRGHGIVLDKLGMNEEALDSFDKLIQINPDDHQAWNNRGIALNNLSRYEESLASFERAIQINLDSSEYCLNYGIIFNKLFEYSQSSPSTQPPLHELPLHQEPSVN
jgi:tetratricopeptide (TPR) repeat protein